MADSDRDHRGRLPSGKRCPESATGGCAYCGTGSAKRSLRRKGRHQAKIQIRREMP